MAPSLLLFVVSFAWAALSLPLILTTAGDEQGEDPCSPHLCGSVNISFPFGIVPEQAADTNCGAIGFQVRCTNNTPYLGYNREGHWLRILDIFYHNASLLTADMRKLQSLDGSANNGSCRIPENNSSTKLALPFSINPLNQELIFYNCSEAPGKLQAGKGLVETRCRNETFVRSGGRYDEESSNNYFLEGCSATVVPVLGGSGEVNASRYERLIHDGFLLTYQTPPLPTSPPSQG
ncbi:hypothetical protein EJB05_31722, partial [Eragrostis curvula]